MNDLFAEMRPAREEVGDDVVLLPAFANSSRLMGDIEAVAALSPFRNMKTPSGHTMSVAMSNCGRFGWTSSEDGYRYVEIDPVTKNRWPAIPDTLQELAVRAAGLAGFSGFQPDACLINRYAPGSRLTPHQDRDELNLEWPIVSVSLGVPAVFQMYGKKRGGSPQLIKLQDGDVLVWGGSARLNYHGVKKLESSHHPVTGRHRYNLTFRRAR